MPITPIACPNCGQIMQANALETAGAVATPCLSCNEIVYVETDDRGRVAGIYVGEEGEAFSSISYDVAEEEADEPRRSGMMPLLLGLLGLLVIAWVASTFYGTKPQPQTAMLEPTPSATPEASPAPSLTGAAPIVFDSLSEVSFALDKAVLTEEGKIALSGTIEQLKASPKGTIFEIGGHTDNQGSEDYNKKLSLQRAEAVRKYLIEKGVPAAALRAKGYGAMKPVVGNETDIGRAQNRRIEITQVK